MVQIRAAQSITLNGTISANGQHAQKNGGGAAGGSVFISAKKLSGGDTSGSNFHISAQGGDGLNGGGGGGGGRISIEADEYKGVRMAISGGLSGEKSSCQVGGSGTFFHWDSLEG